MGGFESVSENGSFHKYTTGFKVAVVNFVEKNGTFAISHDYAAAVSLTSVLSTGSSQCSVSSSHAPLSR
jgi:hypothetical protein